MDNNNYIYFLIIVYCLFVSISSSQSQKSCSPIGICWLDVIKHETQSDLIS